MPALPKFYNLLGVREIRIGVHELDCIGTLPPQDHPHVYLAMQDGAVLCTYCATWYRFDARLAPTETDPPGCHFDE